VPALERVLVANRELGIAVGEGSDVIGTLEEARSAAEAMGYPRVDTACFPGWTITPHYDSLLAKVIARGEDRGAAIARLRHALAHLRVEGVETTAEFARDVLAHPDVERGAVHTRWLEEVFLPYWPVAEVAA
jgi:acetyl/propionyl-CoA carboxylase alpha subunit